MGTVADSQTAQRKKKEGTNDPCLEKIEVNIRRKKSREENLHRVKRNLNKKSVNPERRKVLEDRRILEARKKKRRELLRENLLLRKKVMKEESLNRKRK